MKWKVLLSDIDLSSKELKAVERVLKSRWLSLGEVTADFEKSFARFVGAKHALAVSNGTAALHLALLAGGVGAGDEVLVPSLTFVATVNSIIYCQATPVFVDIASEADFNISLADLEHKISSRTKAILVIHYAGYPVDMPKLKSIVAQAESRWGRSIPVIEDAAHAPGAAIAGRKCGTWGEIGCFSFFANKNLVTGEGGMLVTDSDQQAAKLKLLRSHGMTSLSWERHQGHAHSYDVVDLGYNYRLTEIEAALGIEQLKKLRRSNSKRGQLTKLYRRELKGLSDITLPFAKAEGKPSYHILPILLSSRIDRHGFIQALKDKGIQTSIHYPPVHKFSYYQRRFSYLTLPVTEEVASREVTLPLHPRLTSADVKYVCRAIKACLKQTEKC